MEKNKNTGDFSDVVGQHFVKRALEIVASGEHNTLMIGPPDQENPCLLKEFHLFYHR